MRERWHDAPASANQYEEDFLRILKEYGFVESVRIPGYVLDIRMMKDKKNYGYTEVKGRINLSIKTYPSLLLELPKVNAGFEHAARLQCRFWVAVPYVEGWHVVDMLKAERLYIKDGGRYDRNDRLDIGKMVFIPMVNFKAVDIFMQEQGFTKEKKDEGEKHNPVSVPKVPDEIQERVADGRRDLFS